MRLLVALGVDPSLCAPDGEARVHQLLKMSPQDLDQLQALQEVVAEPHWPRPLERSFQKRKRELDKLLQEGANPSLCCMLERRRIEEYLTWTEDDIAELDRKRLFELNEKERKAEEDYRAHWGHSWLLDHSGSSPEASDSER